MVRIAHLYILRPRNRRVRLYQIDGIEQFPATITLIPARFLKAAIRTCPFDIAVRQKTPISIRINLLRDPLFN